MKDKPQNPIENQEVDQIDAKAIKCLGHGLYHWEGDGEFTKWMEDNWS